MTRLARVVAVGVPHHVTQRGNARRFILDGDSDRQVYLDLLRQSIELHSLTLLGYCLMSNHIHLIVTPAKPDSLSRALKDTRQVRCLLECHPSFQWPRLARQVLLLSPG